MLIVDNPGGTVDNAESQSWGPLQADTIHPDCSGQVFTDLLVDISLRWAYIIVCMRILSCTRAWMTRVKLQICIPHRLMAFPPMQG